MCYICKYCGKKYSKNGIFNHERFCSLNPNKSDNTFLHNNAIKTIEYRRSIKELPTIHEVVCEKCGNTFTVNVTNKDFIHHRYKRFCSRKCSNSRIFSQETKDKISNKLLKREKINTCSYCGKVYKKIRNGSVFCSVECRNLKIHSHRKVNLSQETKEKLSLAGRKSVEVQKEARRSKNEIFFCNLCENRFSSTIHNVRMFNGWDADIIIPELKIAILWNGNWHYKEITKSVSLKQIQNRDKIKIDNIKESGYIPYIIKDTGKYNKKFVNKQFDLFLSYLSNND